MCIQLYMRKKYNQVFHHRRSTRLKGHDYASNGLYFVTICALNRECLFGTIDNGIMIHNHVGKRIEFCWREVPYHFQHALLHEFVVMPNHIHGIIEICANSHRPGKIQNTDNQFRSPSLTLGSIIRGFKSGVTQWARQNTSINHVWQRGYYDHIIRNRHAYYRIVNYINRNPERWMDDMFHPDV